MSELQDVVARSADVADLHATVPTLLLEAQSLLGAVAAGVTTATERGRRPFRPDADFAARLGELAYELFLVADQAGTDLVEAVRLTASHRERSGRAAQDPADARWPFDTR